MTNSFNEYCDKYKFIKMRREDGILEATLHTSGDSLRWDLETHGELERVFLDISRDYDNEVVILTGAGEEFIGPAVQPGTHPGAGTMTPVKWDPLFWEGRHLLMNYLNIEVPVICAVNGPAYRHAELPVMADIVLSAPEGAFQDTAHFPGGMLPGDGVQIIFPLLMGLNRGRYFLLTGQKLSAQEAKEMGLVNEVIDRAELLPRAWALARQLLLQTKLNRRYTRHLLVQELKEKMTRHLGLGLALEGAVASSPSAANMGADQTT